MHGETEQRLYSPGGLARDELAHLSLAVVSINGWNRLSIAARTVPGDYVAGSVTKLPATS